ncbi:hypothetical protein Fcan01_22010 [Folsomia candida]|uniref:Uncharacterized protein n=1 Tax=Folsomia candida TaxID=158441 RepID=A0A226DEE9_FOLCA|nr:hypothetical protein Fcan01_22010 [Folsomia candida]
MLATDHQQVVQRVKLTNTHMTLLGQAVDEIHNTVHEDRNEIRKIANRTIVIQDEVAFLLSGMTQQTLQSLHNNAVERCLEGRLHRYFVSEATLQYQVSLLNSRLATYNYTTAIPINQTSKLYNTQGFTLCSITGEVATIIINIPIRRILPHRSYQITPVPFLHNGSVCLIEMPHKHIALKGTRIYPIRLTEDCQYGDNKLCLISTYDFFDTFNIKCLDFLSTETSITALKKHCRVVCTQYTSPIVLRTRNTTIVVTDKKEADIMCPNSTSTVELLGVGTTQLTIPCNCGISVDTSIYPPLFPCPKEEEALTSTHLIPGCTNVRKHVDEYV